MHPFETRCVRFIVGVLLLGLPAGPEYESSKRAKQSALNGRVGEVTPREPFLFIIFMQLVVLEHVEEYRGSSLGSLQLP